jgi:hypothetical protein
MGESNLSTLFRRLEHRQDDLQRCHAPASIVGHRPVFLNGVVHFFQLGPSPALNSLNRLVVQAFVVVHVDSAVGLADGAALTADDHEPCVLLEPRAAARFAVTAFEDVVAFSAEAASFLPFGVFGCAARAQRLAQLRRSA